MEYNVCQDDIRKSEEKYVYNQEGLPVGEYSIFLTVINKVKIESAGRFSLGASSLHFIQYPRRYRICRQLSTCRKNSPGTIPLGSKPPLLTRIGRPGLGISLGMSREVTSSQLEMESLLTGYARSKRRSEIGKASSV